MIIKWNEMQKMNGNIFVFSSLWDSGLTFDLARVDNMTGLTSKLRANITI